MSTKHTSFIPMAPGLRPQQRLYEVVTLPDLPKGLDPKIEMDQPLLKNPLKTSPRKLTYLFSVEWAWSPMHNRIANYYINPKPWGWAFWDNILDDYTVPWSWYWNFIAYSGKTEADERTIAAYMLLEAWKDEAKEQMLDHYHWINNTGCLEIEDIQAIARKVW